MTTNIATKLTQPSHGAQWIRLATILTSHRPQHTASNFVCQKDNNEKVSDVVHAGHSHFNCGRRQCTNQLLYTYQWHQHLKQQHVTALRHTQLSAQLWRTQHIRTVRCASQWCNNQASISPATWSINYQL